jgi:outer membrane protein assembly factor BamB
MTRFVSEFLLLLIWLISCSSAQDIDPERQWPSYRGYHASGVLDNANLPDTWDADKNVNMLWKFEIPGLGLSSPVIWGDRLFITTALSTEDNKGFKIGMYGNVNSVNDDSEHKWIIYCLDKNSGELLWERTAYKGVPEIKRHPKSSHANTTIATDGKHVVVFFGSEGLYCYDMEGQLLWSKDFGVLKSVFFAMESAEWEFASSPIIHEGVVIVQCDVLENSFVAAYEATTGKEIWKQERDEYPGWYSPNIYYDGDQCRVVVNGYLHRGAYDFKTGEEIWRMSGGGDIPIPTPVVSDNLIYFNSSHGRESPIYAIRTNAKGDITLKEGELTNEFVQWSIPRGGAYMQTMLLYGDYLYNCRWNGSVTCYQAQTGEEIWSHKAGSGNSYTASPVASDGKLYITDDKGMVYVLATGSGYMLLAENPLGDICMTAPAITDHIIFFRTLNYVIAVSEKPQVFVGICED